MRGLTIALRGAAKKWQVRELAVGCAAVALCGGLLTQAAVADGTPAPVKAPANYDSVAWAGLNWGLGIAADFDVFSDRVAAAQIINNIVRVTDTSGNVDVSFVLEAHYFLRDFTIDNGTTIRGPGLCGNSLYCTEMASGPFVAVEVGGGTSTAPTANNPITGYALGWMVGLRHPAASTSSTSSWNLGIGLRIDPKAQVLGDGFVPNQPPPNGETTIRYKTEPRAGVMVMSSFSF